jgi:hypothetical protein
MSKMTRKIHQAKMAKIENHFWRVTNCDDTPRFSQAVNMNLLKLKTLMLWCDLLILPDSLSVNQSTLFKVLWYLMGNSLYAATQCYPNGRHAPALTVK